MKQSRIEITYKDKKYILDRKEDKNCPIVFDAERWSIRIYALANNNLRIIIEKSIKKSATEYHIQFFYDCYCEHHSYHLFLNDVCDPATCRKIKNRTKWHTIQPILNEIYTQLKEDIINLLDGEREKTIKKQNEGSLCCNLEDEINSLLSCICNETTLNFNNYMFLKKLSQADKNNIHAYWQYRINKTELSNDDANSLLMEIISELTDIALESEFCISIEDMCNEDGCFYEKYQDRFNSLYDEIEDILINYDFKLINR